jgi:HSP20 family protein
VPDIVPVKHATPELKRDASAAEPPPGRLAQPYARDLFWTPFREFDDLWERMVSRVFGAPAWADWPRDWNPALDIEETEDAWIFEVELPGVDRDHVEVLMSGTDLSISGETTERERAGVLRHRTRRTGAFRYRTTLPDGVDPDQVEAGLENGVLTVRVPRPEHAKARRIKIR